MRLAPKTQISKLRLGHLDFNRKLNSKPDLFSSIFWFEHSFRCKNAILFFALFTREKCPLRPKKWHFWWQNQNSKTTFIVQTIPKYCRKGFYFMKLSLLSPILAKFQNLSRVPHKNRGVWENSLSIWKLTQKKTQSKFWNLTQILPEPDGWGLEAIQSWC